MSIQIAEEKQTASADVETMTMKVATVVKPGRIELQEKKVPEPQDDEVLIKMSGCGICASNLPPFEGREWFHYPLDKGGLGHEGWGVIHKVGKDVNRFKRGDLVTALSYHAFAEYDVAVENNVVKLSEALAGKPFPGEPLGCAINIFKRCDIQADQTVAIIGAGFLGCLLIQLAKQKQAKVIVISRRKSSLEMAEKMGADEIIGINHDALEKVKELTKSKFCDRVIEATGKQQPLDLAGEITAIRGKLIIAGFHQDGERKVNMQLWNWRGLDVINAHERDPEIYIRGIEDAVDAVRNGILNPYPLYTHTFPFEDIQLAFETLRNRPEGYVKALLTF